MFFPHLPAHSTSRARDLEAEEELSARKFNPCKWLDSSTLSHPLLPQYHLKNEWGPFHLTVLNQCPSHGCGGHMHACGGGCRGSP